MSERKGEAITLAWSVPKDQSVSYKITPKPGCLCSAKSIGAQLKLLALILETEYRQDVPDLKSKASIAAIYTEADGSIRFDLVVMPNNEALSALGNNLPESGKEFPEGAALTSNVRGGEE